MMGFLEWNDSADGQLPDSHGCVLPLQRTRSIRSE
jgi:hypothetical protein